MSPSDLTPFVSYLKAQRLFVDHAQIAAFTVLFYDYLLMMNLEITLIWMQKWTYTTILFILTRYLPFAYAYFVLQNHLLIGPDPESCAASFTASTWMLLAGMTVAEMILSVRTWAVWHCNFKVGLLLIGLHIANPIVACIYLSRYMNSFIYKPAPYPGFRGCLVSISNGDESVTFIMLAAVETVVFCLMAAAAFRAYRSGFTNQFSKVVHRDALHFYVFLMLLAIANVIVMLVAPPIYQNFLIAPQGVLHSVFTCRIVLHLRVASRRGRKDMPTDLHTRDAEDEMSTLAFQERVEEVSLRHLNDEDTYGSQ